MIRMSKQTDYGILLLTHVARKPQGWVHSARELAAAAHLPLPMVSKILKLLAREGLLISQRGPKGGYLLAYPPKEITIARIINSIEGPIAITECVDAPGDCRQEATCSVRINWHRINRAVREALEKISLSDMAQPLPDEWVPVHGSPADVVNLT